MLSRHLSIIWRRSWVQCHARCYGKEANHRVVDLRSDTVTMPSPEMREAMATAEVGDDVMGEDPSVNKLQVKLASLLGKEAALFVPSGTMGNLISVMSHCNSRGLEVLLGNKSHICLFEQGGIAQVAGVHPRTINNLDDGTFCIDELKGKIRPTNDPHQPRTKLVCIENTHNMCGGKIVPLEFMEQVGDVCKDKGMLLHMDGARIFNAAAAMSVSLDVLVEHCDSVSICFSKGLGCPVGSVIAGSESFIASAKRCRKVLGGGLRQAGILASAALHALEHNVPKLKDDHVKLEQIASTITSVDPKLASVEEPHTNILLIHFNRPEIVNAPAFCQRMLQVDQSEVEALGEGIVVKMYPFGNERMARIVTHIDLSFNDVKLAKKKFEYVLNEYASQQ